MRFNTNPRWEKNVRARSFVLRVSVLEVEIGCCYSTVVSGAPHPSFAFLSDDRLGNH